MGVFDIHFTSDEPEEQDEGWYALPGEVVLGNYRESFLASLSLWTREQYEEEWLHAARRLLMEGRTGFVTSAVQFWWPMWRDGDRIRVHEELPFPDRVGNRALLTTP